MRDLRFVRILSLIISLTVLISSLGAVSFSAADFSYEDFSAASGGVLSATMSNSPETAEYNETITFNVVTDTNTSKVKIMRGTHTVFAVADIFNGFTDFIDSGSTRTWNITRKIQILSPDHFYIYAGNCSYGYSDNKFSILSQFITESEPKPVEGLYDCTAQEIIGMIDIGWNLGNTLDSHGEWIDLYTSAAPSDFETAWGNPVTTKAMIDAVKKAGFTTVRIPTTWYQHLDENNDIDAAWMARVKEIVNYVIDNDMFAILNTHHEDEWLTLDGSKDYNGMETRLTAIWAQISEEFGDYDQHLIFEIMNEPRNVGGADEWTGGNANSYVILNNLHSATLRTIRNSGKNNDKRIVVMSDYACSDSRTPLFALNVPDDDYIIVQVHSYSPYNYTTSPSAAYDSTIEAELTYMFQRFSEFRQSHNNVPMIIGEFGCFKKDNVQDRIDWATKFLSEAKNAGIPCVIWDNGNTDEYGIFNRNACSWNDTSYLNAMMNVYGK